MRPARRILVLAACAGAVVLLALRGGPDGQEFPDPPPRLPREFEGVVLLDGKPVEGAQVLLFEDLEGGSEARALTDAAGAFRLTWVPTATERLDRLFLATEAKGRRVVAPARPEGTTLRLARPVVVEGRVVDLRGEPVPRAGVLAAVGPFAYGMTAARDGTFSLSDVPDGARLDVLVVKVGFQRRLERRFRAGDRLTLHLVPGYEIDVVAFDPQGARIEGAKWSRTTPLALREHDIPDFQPSDGGPVLVMVEADGFLPAELPAWPGGATEVILWPARDVEVQAWDAWNQRGVPQVRFDVEIQPGGGTWTGENVGAVARPVPFRVGDRVGRYRLRVPACPVTLHAAAPAYGDGQIVLDEETTRAVVRLQPLRMGERRAMLALRAKAGTPDLPLIVADEAGRWITRVELRDGQADVAVPPQRRLQIASPIAAAGLWVPRLKVEPVPPGQKKAVKIGTLPAARLVVRVEPAVPCEVTVVDVVHEKVVPPQRVDTANGRAEFWVRPARDVKVRATPKSNHFPYDREFQVAREGETITMRLRRAAGVRYRVRDRKGNAIPFAAARLWEAGRDGLAELRARPKVRLADALGEITWAGLRGGRAAVEISAPGFRTRRFGLVPLVLGKMLDAEDVVLEPAGVQQGRVLGPDGTARARVQVRALAPRVRRLEMPGGGERDLYDLTAESVGDAATGADGRFTVRDASPRAPVIALYPRTLAAAAFTPSEEYRLTEAAYVELDVPGTVQGVYLLLGTAAAVLVKRDPPLGLRPLPLVLPAGRHSLFVRLRDRRWAAQIFTLRPGEKIRLKPAFQR